MLRYKTETRPGLVTLYDIRPGNGMGPFLQPRSPHRAQEEQRRGRRERRRAFTTSFYNITTDDQCNTTHRLNVYNIAITVAIETWFIKLDGTSARICQPILLSSTELVTW